MTETQQLLLRVKYLMEEIEGFEDPYLRFRFDAAQARVNSNSVGDLRRFETMLSSIAVKRRIHFGERIREPDWPAFPRETSVCFGYAVPSGKEVRVPLTQLTKHTLIAAPSGKGKSTLVFFLIDQVPVPILFKCNKNEGRRLVNRYDDVLVFRLNEIPQNLLCPVGRPDAYHSSHAQELRRFASLRPETARKVLAALQIVEKSVKDSSRYPSLAELVKVIRSQRKGRESGSIANAAAALETMFDTIRPMSRIIKGPSDEELSRYRIHVHEFVDFATPIQRYVSVMNLLRYQARAYSFPKTLGLSSLYVSDEAGIEFAKELQSGAGSGEISPQKRMITQLRSSGQGIVAGIQNLNDVDPALLNNCDTFVFMGAQNPEEIKTARELLRLPFSRIKELDTLAVGEFYLRSGICKEPIRCRFPNFDVGPYVSDELLDSRLGPVRKRFDSQTTKSPETEIEAIDLDEILGREPETVEEFREASGEPSDPIPAFVEDWYSLLRDIETHPDYGVIEHRKSVGFSASKIGRVKQELLKHRLVRCERVASASGGRPRETMTLTVEGEAFLKRYASRPRD